MVGDTISYLKDKKGNPLILAPTASGKSHVLCDLTNEYLSWKPKKNVIVLSHVSEILEQNYNSLWNYFDGEQLGLYSAGLSDREVDKITVAGIQSAYRNPKQFKKTGLIIVDEAHGVNVENEGMYRKFIDKINCPVVGLTATPWRLGHGLIYGHEENYIFNGVSSNWITGDKFNRLIDDGYLCVLSPSDTKYRMDTSDIPTLGGEFNQKALAEKFNRYKITKIALKETYKAGKKRNKWLAFAIDIRHCENIAAHLRANGISAKVIHSEMREDRNKVIKQYRKGKFRCLVGVNIPTTGLDIPDIDYLINLSPTNSPTRYVQKFGRGMRVHDNKDNCLYSDFAGDLERHGEINNIIVHTPKKRKKEDQEPPVKFCPKCNNVEFPAVRICSKCGHKFEFKEKITMASSGKEIIKHSKNKPSEWIGVLNATYRLQKISSSPYAPKVILITYTTYINKHFKKFLAYEHAKGSTARINARAWVNKFLGYEPDTIDELVIQLRLSKKPSEIFVDYSGKKPEVIKIRK